MKMTVPKNKFFCSVMLGLLMAFSQISVVRAELPYETIDDIQIPTGVTFGTQVTWQGHAITHARKEGNRYIVEIARDGEPHQFPYFHVAFDLNWNYIGTTTRVDPAAIKAAEEAKKKAEEEAKKKAEDAARAEAERLEKERQEREKPKPEPQPEPEPVQPPVTKPPEEEPEEPPPDEEPVPES